MSNHLADPNESDEDQDPFGPRHEKLQKIVVKYTPESSPDHVSAQPVSPAFARKGKPAKRSKKNQPSQGDTFLLSYLAPNHPEVARAAATTAIHCDSESEEVSGDSDVSMEEEEDLDTQIAKSMELKEKEDKLRAEVEAKEAEERKLTEAREEEERKIRKAEEKAQRESEERAREEAEARAQLEAEERAAQQEVLRSKAAEALLINTPGPYSTTSPSNASPEYGSVSSNGVLVNDDKLSSVGLGVTTTFKIPAYPAEAVDSPRDIGKQSFPNHPEDSMLNSPLSVHLKQSDSPAHKLPALQSPGSPDGPGSPQNQQKLPGISHINEIANKANEGIMRRFSTGGQSPAFPNGPVRSPYPLSHPSPGMLSEASPRSALSPHSGITGQFLYTSRRPSQTSDYPSLPSASTTDSSYAGTDGYSPSTQPTPQSETHRMSLDGTGPPILPPPVPSLQPLSILTSVVPAHGSGGFQCDYDGCTAPPFQTQYLLNSHANVHSQNRPHYCPVTGCPRASGGKGFKRKNEMIRHGLVHESPGYVCPFCPDREHKYPRPDNLQRHVRVHHVDKSKDDPALRDVLAQRPEGGNRGRRRRLGSG